jgi:hypothetical protein
MSQQTENRLQAALAAKAGGITQGMLRQPRLPERGDEFADFDSEVFRLVLPDPAAEPADPTGSRRRWRPQLVAAAALAAVAAVILATLAIVSWPAGHRPATPGKPSSGYLGPGQTGTRDQVPWSAVGAGWRLFQPLNFTSTDPATRTTRFLYLYDPADGRYLITDQLPAGGWVLDWSPDGARALVETFGKPEAFLQIQLRTGAVVSSAAVPDSVGLKYADAQGSAILVKTQGEMRRYGIDGKLQLRYPSTGPNGVIVFSGALRTDDGAGTVVQSAAGATMLLTEAGAVVRRYPLPDQKTGCHPIQLWGDGFLEACASSTDPGKPNGLYVQPLSGGSARLLIDRAGPSGSGFISAWQLSNGDVLLRNEGSSAGGPCVDENYALLHPDGALTALRLPASIAPIARIFNVDRDMATFMPGGTPCSEPNAPFQPKELVDYNLVTGQTATLPAEDAQIVNYPSDGQVQIR